MKIRYYIFAILVSIILIVIVSKNTNYDKCFVSEKEMISLESHSVEGDYYVIKYYIKFPGVTKIRIMDSERKILFFSQYVDDVVGLHKIVLKYSNMKPKLYIFEIEFKNNIKTFTLNKK